MRSVPETSGRPPIRPPVPLKDPPWPAHVPPVGWKGFGRTVFGETTYFGVGASNHCATICPWEDGVLIAFYTGREGSREQRVVLVHWRQAEGAYEVVRVFPGDTGNPVIWLEPSGDAVTLLYSRFERTGGWVWADCSLWLARFEDKEGAGLQPVDLERFPARTGLVGRCPPVRALRRPQGLLLPLYHERPAYGAIYLRRSSTSKWKRLGTIGKEHGCVMQPALWTIDNRYYALCRNHGGHFTEGAKRAWYSTSADGRRWEGPVPSKTYDNSDNSVTVAADGLDSWVVWNEGPGRRKLVLAPLSHPDRRVQLNTGPMAGYPSCCWVGRDLHVVWTESRSAHVDIGHRVFRGIRGRKL